MRRAAVRGCSLLALALGAALPAEAQVITARVGGELAGTAGSYIEVPVTVDMTGAPGKQLAGYRMTVTWDPVVLAWVQIEPGNFASPTVATDSVYYGQLRVTALVPAGVDGVITLFVLRFYVYSDAAPTNISISFGELNGPAPAFEDLLPFLTVENGTFCREIGTWGDLDGDGTQNSRDALMTLSAVVGLTLDSLINPALGDVDGDGNITSRDALIILSYAVGLPVDGFRIGLKAAGACATGSAATLVIEPDSIELQVGQVIPAIVRAFDASGREVPLATLVWRSSNSSVAAWQDTYSDPGVAARSPGTVTLTAEMGPGLRASLKVVVIARRRNWYVDIARLNTPIQTGSARYPFAFIGDALEEPNAQDGDTVRVAPGIYEEIVSDYVSVVLLGDPANRPVLDPRGTSYYSPTQTAMYMGSAAATAQVEHFVFRGGGLYLEGHDNIVRNVRFEDITSYEVLEIYSQAFVPVGSPPAGAALAERNLGRVLIENVVVDNYQYGGFYVYQADSAFVRNNTVSRDSAYTTYCGEEGLAVWEANYSEVSNNVVTNACKGIIVEQELGKTVISRNRVSGTFRSGIEASVPIVQLDHNVVRDGSIQNYSATNYGIYVYEYYSSDSVVSIGDSIINVGYDGIVVDTARVGVIDSLVVSNWGRDSSSTPDGVSVRRGRYTVSHSVLESSASSSVGIAVCGATSVLRTRGNRIAAAAGMSDWTCGYGDGQPDTLISVQDTISAALTGIYAATKLMQVDSADLTGQLAQNEAGVYAYYVRRLLVRDSRVRRFGYGVYAEGSTTAEIRGNALIADSVGAYLSLATDSAVVVGNTVDSSRNGLSLFAGQETRVDSNLVRVTSAGAILFVNMNSAVDVRANTIDSAGTQGINFTTSPGGRVAANSISRTQVGILLNTLSDSTILTGNVIDQSGADGVNVSGSLIRADSNKITNSGLSGLVFYVGGSGRLTRNRFQNNGSYGVGIDNSLYSTSPSLANNIIQGNVLGGANNGSYPYATMDADSNYWGDPNGPRCNIAVTGVDCSASVAGDSVLSAGITFTPFLSSPPGGVPAAPPARPVFSASRRPVSAEGPVAAAAPEGQVRPSVLRGPRLSEAPQGSQPAASRPGRAAAERQETQRKSFPMAWQKGREPRQPRPPATRN